MILHVWLVNPFDPLPGGPEPPGRYATLAAMLAERGHQVLWWTSAFSHRFHRYLDQPAAEEACRRAGIEVRFLPVPAYRWNVSLGRLWNHYLLSRRFVCQASAEPRRPDVIVASTPPPGLARSVARIAGQRKVPLVLDVQDLWPETFARLSPTWLRPVFDLATLPMRRSARRACQAATAIVGVADGYVEHAVRLGGAKAVTRTVPLGVDLAAFDAATEAGGGGRFLKPHGETWLVYAGSLTRSYDCLTVLHAAAMLRDRKDLRFFLAGRGELEEPIRRIIADQRLENVTLTGFLDPPACFGLMRQCDIGINSCLPEAMILLPNKLFAYLAAGLAVLNAIPGQCSRIVNQAWCGLDYRPGDAASCAAAIMELIEDDCELEAMRRSARKLAEDVYDRRKLYAQYVDLIEAGARSAAER
jgi:glycosyltransferase involved in cell wall biosynthesis